MKKFTLLLFGVALVTTDLSAHRSHLHHGASEDSQYARQSALIQNTPHQEASTAANYPIWSPNTTAVRSNIIEQLSPRQIAGIPEDAEIIFDQDFSLLTEGSETEIGPSLIPTPITSIDDVFISAEYMGEEGWLGNGVRSAGGMIALTNPTPYGYNTGGMLDTPDHEMYGRVFIKFRAKVIPIEGKNPSATFYVSCAINKLDTYPQAVNNLTYKDEGAAVRQFKMTASEGWQDIEMMVYNPYKGEDCFVQINCSYPDSGLLVDDLIVARDYGFSMPPTNLLSYDFTDDGFTVRWEPGANNTSYLLTLMEQREDGQTESSSVDLNNIIVDNNGKITSLSDLKGIEISLVDNRGTIDEGFEGSGAVILTNDNDAIKLPDEDKPIVEGSLYLKADVASNSNALLYIEGYDDLYGYTSVIGSIPLKQAI